RVGALRRPAAAGADQPAGRRAGDPRRPDRRDRGRAHLYALEKAAVDRVAGYLPADGAAGPGDRPLGQLLQPGSLRPPDELAVRRDDRREPPAAALRYSALPARHAVSRDVSLRVDLEPGRPGADPVAGAAAAPGAGRLDAHRRL